MLQIFLRSCREIHEVSQSINSKVKCNISESFMFNENTEKYPKMGYREGREGHFLDVVVQDAPRVIQNDI